MQICISSGHGKYVAGACGIIREHEEAVRVVNQLAQELRALGADVQTFEDTVSKTQSENLDRIVDWHNSMCGIWIFPCTSTPTSKKRADGLRGAVPVAARVWPRQLSAAIAEVGFINRGAKKRTDLAFLNGTSEPAVLIETCFVDSEDGLLDLRRHVRADLHQYRRCPGW